MFCKSKDYKAHFTDSQQQLFVSSFYCYLNYHPTSDFVIDLDNIWEWLGFNQKYGAKRMLEIHFIQGVDYKILLPRSGDQDGTSSTKRNYMNSITTNTLAVNCKYHLHPIKKLNVLFACFLE